MLAPENPFAGKKKPSLGGFCEDNVDEVACSIIHSNMPGLIYNIVLAASQKTLSQIRLEFSLVICRCIIMSQIFIIFLQKVSLFHSYSRTCPCPYICAAISFDHPMFKRDIFFQQQYPNAVLVEDLYLTDLSSR